MLKHHGNTYSTASAHDSLGDQPMNVSLACQKN